MSLRYGIKQGLILTAFNEWYMLDIFASDIPNSNADSPTAVSLTSSKEINGATH